MTRKRTTAALVGALALTLSSCSGGGDGDGGGDDGASGADGTVSIAVSEPDHLNPGRQTGAFDQVLSLFAPLTDADDDGEVSMVAAESVTSEDATTWTITLKDGWTFHDGEEVTAKSYVDAWNAVAYAPNAWENNGQLVEIAGYADLNPAEGEPTSETLSGLAVVDDSTFTVTLSAPDSQFPLQLGRGSTGFYPLPSSAYDDLDAFDAEPVGNGPYRMTEKRVADEPITLTAWEDYQGPKPKVGKLEFRPYTDFNTAYVDVQAGQLDAMVLPPNKATTAEADFGDHLYTFEAPGIDYLGLPIYDERYADIRVRQAISMAIDREGVNEVIYGGLQQPATAYTPPVMLGTPEGACGKFCEYDPEAAKALLDEAGGFDGTMELVFPGDFGLQPLYEAYANQLRQNLGIDDVVVKPTTNFAEFVEQRSGETLTGPFFSRWGSLYPSQQNILRAVFTPTGGCKGCVPYENQEVVDLIAAADAQPDAAAAAKGYAAAQERIFEDFPAPPMFFNTYSFVTSDRVEDLPQSSGSAVWSQIVLAEDA